MELSGENKDEILNLIAKKTEQEVLLHMAKQQLGVGNGNDILLFLAFYDTKYTETSVQDGKKFWHLSKDGNEFLKKGGFSRQKEKELKDKILFYGLIVAVVVVAAIFVWSEFRIL